MLGAHALNSWLTIRRGKQRIREVVREVYPKAGVFAVRGSSYVDPQRLAFFITTATDAESSKLRETQGLYEQLCDALRQAGYPPAAVPSVKFRIESQQTVDRDYGGSWAEAIEMPQVSQSSPTHHR
jgi:hypothetical protein